MVDLKFVLFEGDDKCRVQVDATSFIANTCCSKDLCNSAIQLSATTGVLFLLSLTVALIHRS